MKIDAIIQARMGSTRLPGKVLMQLNGITLLECLFNQLNYTKLLERKVLATSTNPEDDVIESLANSIFIECFRGNSLDVLDRYYQCAKYYSMEHIVRITGDCPLIDPEIVDKVISLYKTGKFDYVNNFNKRTFPSGTEIEVFSFKTLEKTWKNATKLSEREHVTPYVYNNSTIFSIGYVEYSTDISHLHWAVDRIEDLELVKTIYNKTSKNPILLGDILRILNEEPSILEINKNTNPAEGYLKSLQADE